MQQLRSQTLRDITVLTWCNGDKTSPESCFSVHHQVIICLWMFGEHDRSVELLETQLIIIMMIMIMIIIIIISNFIY